MFKYSSVFILLFIIHSFKGLSQSADQLGIIHGPSAFVYHVDSLINNEKGKPGKTTIGTITYKFYIEDTLHSVVTDTLIAKAEIRHDTIYILAWENILMVPSFSLALFRDSCKINNMCCSEGIEHYKSNEADTILQMSTGVPVKEQRLTLTRHPQLKLGEVIEGLLEFSSMKYYDKSGRYTQRIHFKANFKASVVESVRLNRQ